MWSQGIGTTQRNEIDYATNGYAHRYDYAAGGSYTLRRYRYGRLELLQSCDASGATNTQTAFRYDPHSRLWQETELRNGTTTYAYNNADQVTAVTAPAPGPEAAPRITRTHYNQMLQATNVVFPDQTSAFTEYHLTGEIKRTYGSRSYPVEYTVDYAGRVRSVKTWRNSRDTNTSAVTVWNYNPRRGWLDNQRYADGRGPDYEHWPSGKLRQRTWARRPRRARAFGSPRVTDTMRPATWRA